MQNQLHKISILQIKSLKNLEQEQVYEEYLYIKPKIQDFFYFQTGMEIDEFNHSVIRLDMEQDPEFQQLVKDYI